MQQADTEIRHYKPELYPFIHPYFVLKRLIGSNVFSKDRRRSSSDFEPTKSGNKVFDKYDLKAAIYYSGQASIKQLSYIEAQVAIGYIKVIRASDVKKALNISDSKHSRAVKKFKDIFYKECVQRELVPRYYRELAGE